MPWLVSFVKEDEVYIGHCTASLISPKYVLLAAHCVDDIQDGTDVSVHYGATRRSEMKTANVDKSSIQIHPKWVPGSEGQDGTGIDLAVVKVTE